MADIEDLLNTLEDDGDMLDLVVPPPPISTMEHRSYDDDDDNDVDFESDAPSPPRSIDLACKTSSCVSFWFLLFMLFFHSARPLGQVESWY